MLLGHIAEWLRMPLHSYVTHPTGNCPVGILTCSRANIALSDKIPLARLMFDT